MVSSESVGSGAVPYPELVPLLVTFAI